MNTTKTVTLTSAERHYAADVAAGRCPATAERAVREHYAPLVRAGLVGSEHVDHLAAYARRRAKANEVKG